MSDIPKLYPPQMTGSLVNINFIELDDEYSMNEALVILGVEPKFGQSVEEKIQILKQFGFREF